MFGLFSSKNINKGVEKWRNTQGAVLLDVRTRDEYSEYHIEGSINIPLDELEHIEQQIPDKTTVVFVHCLSGGRSARAASYLKSKGYSDVYDIGGINSYRGETT